MSCFLSFFTFKEACGSVVEQWSCNWEVPGSKPSVCASALDLPSSLKDDLKAVGPLVAYLQAHTCFLSS